VKRVIPFGLHLVAGAIGIGILWFLIYKAGVSDLAAVFLKLSAFWISLAIAVYAVSWVFRTWRLKILTNLFQGEFKAWDLFKMHIVAYALNSILPAKAGDVAMVGFLRSKTIKTGQAAAVTLQMRILDALALIVLLLPSLYLLTENSQALSALLVCFLVVAVPIGTVLLDRRGKISQWLESLENKFVHRFVKLAVLKTKDAYQAYHRIVFDVKWLWVTILLSVIIWLCDGLICFMISQGAGAKLPVVVVMMAIVVANISKSVPLTPGGIGVYESVLMAVFVSFGVSLELAVAIAVLDHFIKKLFNIIFGFIFMADMGIRLKTVYREVADRYYEENAAALSEKVNF